jgi:hypothetical protein
MVRITPFVVVVRDIAAELHRSEGEPHEKQVAKRESA